MNLLKTTMSKSICFAFFACISAIMVSQAVNSADNYYKEVACNENHDLTNEPYATVVPFACNKGNIIRAVIIKSADLREELFRFTNLTWTNNPYNNLAVIGANLPIETNYRVVLQGLFANGVTEYVSDIGYTGRWMTRKFAPDYQTYHPRNCFRRGVVVPHISIRGTASAGCAQ